MKDVWGASKVYTNIDDVVKEAQAIADRMKAAERTPEYSIVKIDTDYTFYQD